MAGKNTCKGIIMFHTENKIRKDIITPEGENEFQVRYIRDENVGVLTTRTKKSYLILDSIDYWYDLIQKKYPSKQKCRCKNDYFKLYFDYVPRVGTDDYRGVELTICCTECGKQKKLAVVDIDYSPTEQLFEQPITYCERPKILYKTYSVSGYWKEESFRDLIGFLSHKQLLIYCWYRVWDENRCYVKQFTYEELKNFLFTEKKGYIGIYFTTKPMEELLGLPSAGRDIWRKEEIIFLHYPIMVAGRGLFYSMDFCSEYLESGEVKAKSAMFDQLVEEVWSYSQKWLRQNY